ncbi:hypothetical protein PG984_015903 [Apiospora sp. TS-2023a]
MTDPRYRQPSGRRSPTFNPARASLPHSIGYAAPWYGGDIHAVPTARYDSSVPRGSGEHRAAPAATITTYNVTKEPFHRSSSVREPSRNRHRSSTLDTGSTIKPIIVTTNHSRPHNSSSHTSSSAARPSSPSQNPYRASGEETYYAQPASSIRARSQHRHTQSATLDNDELYRLRERVSGDDRLRAPRLGPVVDPYRPHSRQGGYVSQPRISTSTVEDNFEYTKPSDLVRHDLDHDGPRSRAGRRESFDRGYYRPSVTVTSDLGRSSDVGRAPARRGPPPPSSALERYNQAAAAGIYDRPSVTMPTPPQVPPSPIRSGHIDTGDSIAVDRRSARPRPVSLYQESTPRQSVPEDIYRPRDEERLHKPRRERGDEGYRDDAVAARGFGLRPEYVDHTEHRRPVEPERSIYEERRSRREPEIREPKRRSDESLDLDRARPRERRPSELKERPYRIEDDRSSERKDSRDSVRGDKVRDKVAAGLGVAAAAIGLGAAAKDKDEGKDGRGSPKRRSRSPDSIETSAASRAADRYKPREKDIERRPSPQNPAAIEPRRESRRDRDDTDSRERERERDRDRERDREREREKEREREREKEREREREKERERGERKGKGARERARDAEARPLDKDSVKEKPAAVDDDSSAAPKRRHRPSVAAFDPTDTKGLMDLKAELAAREGEEKPKDKEKEKERPSPKSDTVDSSVSDRQRQPSRDRSRDRSRTRSASRGRELALTEAEQKQVRVVSPPRDKSDQKPIKGILKQPKDSFPEDPQPVREGVAPHKTDKTKADAPQGARWTKINRKLVNPEALTIGKERFEVRDDFVIVLRVLSKEEIQQYAIATNQLREKRRREYEAELGVEDDDKPRDRDEEDRRRRHSRRGYEDEEEERPRRHRRDEDDAADRPRALEYGDQDSHHHRRSHRESVDDRDRR